MALPSLFLLLALAASNALQEPDADNVVILLDASGSMKDPMDGPERIQKMGRQARHRGSTGARAAVDSRGSPRLQRGHKENDWVFPLGPRDDQES
jgi:hypothetical protein